MSRRLSTPFARRYDTRQPFVRHVASHARWVPRTALSRIVALILSLALLASPSAAQRPARDPSPHSDAVLVSDVGSVRVGSTITVAVRLTLDDGWHTYWTNPGDAGLPLRVTWTLPDGVTAGPLRFPTPRLAPQPPLMSYGYERELYALTEMQVAPTFTGTSIRLAGKADWLACAEVCLPATGPLALDVPVNAAVATSTTWAADIRATRAALPQPALAWTVTAWTTDEGYTLAIVAPQTLPPTPRPYVFVDSANVIEHAAAQRFARSGDTLVFALPRSTVATGNATTLRGIVTGDHSADSLRSHLIDVPITAKAPATLVRRARVLLADSSARLVGGVTAATTATGVAVPDAPVDAGADMTLIAAILFAFIGGLLLNLMPCVFPVLSVKVLALLQHGGGHGDSARGRRHGLAFGAGVMLSFWLLAGVLMALRAGGESLGWGFQLQSPPVVALLALLMFALALNLSGLFEIGLSLTRLGGAGGGGSYADSLLTGGLAVLVAAPCTAPFMGAALGFALVQPPVLGLLVFTALAIGLALPFMVLASAPNLLRFLPRPGPWLETMKQLFAFPLYATVVWLLWVFGQQAGVDALATVLLAMILLAMGAWLWARGVRSGRATTRGAAALMMVAAIAVTMLGSTGAARPVAAATPQPGWEPWSVQRVAELRQQNRAIFIDFTAAWCLSCQVNERVALHTDAVQRAFAAGNVALLRADWTSRDSAITNALAGFGRSGVPLYVLYPASSTGAAMILPAVLTPGIVVDAVRTAAPTALTSHLVR